MSHKGCVNAWWVACLMAVTGLQPLPAAEVGAVSRAVEVAPPKGWTPDTPLFQDEPNSPPGRDAAPKQVKGEGASTAPRRSASVVGPDRPQATRSQGRGRGEARGAAALAEQKARGPGKASRASVGGLAGKSAGKAPGSGARSAQVGKKPAASARTAAAKRGAERKAAARVDRVAASKRPSSAAKQVRGASVRPAKTQQATPSASRVNRAKVRREVREPAVSRRPAKRAPTVGRGGGAGGKKG